MNACGDCVCAAPKIEYYHATQKTNDEEVARTARGVIDTAEREAYRQKLKDAQWFTKTVSSTQSLLNAHNALVGGAAAAAKPAGQKASLLETKKGIVGGKIRF